MIKGTRYIVSNFGKLCIIVACIYWRDEIGISNFEILSTFCWFWVKYYVKSSYLVVISFENLSIIHVYHLVIYIKNVFLIIVDEIDIVFELERKKFESLIHFSILSFNRFVWLMEYMSKNCIS